MNLPSLQEDLLRVKNIEKSISKVYEILEKADNYEAFLSDWIIQDALIKNIELIGEYVYKMTDELKHAFPDIAWSKIETMRHRLVHEYHGINLK